MARFAVEILVKTAGGPQAKAALESVGVGARSAAPEVQKLVQQLLGVELNIKGFGALAAKAFAGIQVAQIGRQILSETKDAAAAQALLTSAVRSTGGAAGFTAQQLDDMAGRLSALNGIDDEAIAGAEAILLRYTRIGQEVFPQAIQAAIDMASAQGKQIQTTADLAGETERLGKFLGDPIRAMALLKREGRGLGEEQANLILGYIKHNDLLGAQKVLLAEVNRLYGGTAQALRNEIGGALQATSVAWGNLLEEFGKGFTIDSSGVTNLADALSDPKTVQAVRELGEGLGLIARELASITRLAGPLIQTLLKAEQAANPLLNLSRLFRGPGSKPLNYTPYAPYTPTGQGGGTPPPIAPPADLEALKRAAAEAERLREAAAKAVAAARLEAQNAAALLQARTLGTAALKAEISVQEALAKARAAGAGATSAQRLEIIRHSLATDAAKSGIERMNAAEAEATRLFAENNKELTRQLGILSALEAATVDFGRALSEANANQADRGGAIATAATRERLDYAKQWRESWLTAGQVAQTEIEKVQASLLSAAEKQRAIVDILSGQMLASWEPVLRGFEGIASDIGNALGDAFLTGKLEWDKLADSMKRTMASTIADIVSDFLGQWIRAIAQWLARWIASHRVAQATAAQTGAVNAAAGGAGAAGGGAGGAGSAVGALASGSGGASAWSGYGTAAAYVFLAWVGYNIYKGWTKKRATFGELGLDFVTVGSRQISDSLREVVQGIISGISDLTKEWRLGIEELGKVSIGVTSKGVIYVKTALDAVGQVFKTMEEAVEFAKLQAIKLATFGKETSALVQAAIRGSQATTLQGLGSDIDFARMIEGLGLPEIGRQMLEFTRNAVDNFRRAMDLFRGDLSQAAVAVGAIMADFSGNLWSLYNNLLGIKEDPGAQWERNKAAYNAQRAIMVAQITLLYEEVKARVAAYQAHRLYLRGLGGGAGDAGAGGGGGREVGAGSGVRPRSGGSGGFFGKGGWNPNAPQPDNRNPGNDPQLAALLQILDNLARALSGLPPAIEGGYPGARGGGRGGGRADARRSALDQLEDMRARAQGEYAQLLLESDRALREWKETVKEGKLTTAEAAEGERLLREQRQQAIDQFRKGLFADVSAFVGVSPFQQIKDDANALRDRLRDALGQGAIKWREFKIEMDRINAAERERLDILARETIAGTMEGLAKYVTDETLRTQLLQEAAVLKFQIEYANLLATTEQLRAQGRDVALLDAAVRNIGANMPAVLDNIRKGVQNVADEAVRLFPEDYAIRGPGGVLPPTASGDDPRKRALDMLKEWQDIGLHPLVKDLRDLGTDFAFLRQQLGDTTEVYAAHAAKLQDILSRYLDPIREFRTGRQLSNLSTLTGEGQYYEAQKRFRETLAAIQGGDLTKLDQVVNLAQTYGELGQGFTAGEGLRFIMKEIDDALLKLENTVPGIAGALSGSPLGSSSNPIQAEAPGTVTAINQTTTAVNNGNTLLLEELRSANVKLQHHSGLLQQIESRFNDPFNVRLVA